MKANPFPAHHRTNGIIWSSYLCCEYKDVPSFLPLKRSGKQLMLNLLLGSAGAAGGGAAVRRTYATVLRGKVGLGYVGVHMGTFGTDGCSTGVLLFRAKRRRQQQQQQQQQQQTKTLAIQDVCIYSSSLSFQSQMTNLTGRLMNREFGI